MHYIEELCCINLHTDWEKSFSWKCYDNFLFISWLLLNQWFFLIKQPKWDEWVGIGIHPTHRGCCSQSHQYYSREPSVNFTILAIKFEHPHSHHVNKVPGIRLSPWHWSPLLMFPLGWYYQHVAVQLYSCSHAVSFIIFKLIHLAPLNVTCRSKIINV